MSKQRFKSIPRNFYLKDLYYLWMTITFAALFLISLFLLDSDWPWNIVRLIVGFPMFFFIPGLNLMELLFVRKESMTVFEKALLGIVASLSLVVMIGAIDKLNSPAINLQNTGILLAGSSVVLSIAAAFRKNAIRNNQEYAG